MSTDFENKEQELTLATPPNLIQNVAKSKDQSGDHETNILKKKSVEGSSASKKATMIAPATSLDPTSSLQGSLVSSLPKALPQGIERSQGSISNNAKQEITVNQTEKEIKTSPIMNLQVFDDDANRKLTKASKPVVATTKDASVVNALVDLELCLKMPLKDIANSEPNSLRLLTALNFLSCLEDGVLSLRLQAIIQSLLRDFPSILDSFKVAFAIIKFVDEAQEKEVRLKEHISRLEQEIKDGEAELSYFGKQKEKCVEEIREFYKAHESVRKQKSEIVKDKRKVQQQLLEVYQIWSILCGQFQQNHIDMHAHQIMQAALKDSGEIIETVYNKETQVQEASERERLSSEVRSNKSIPPIASQNLTNDVKGRSDGSSSFPKAFSFIKFKGTEMDIDKDVETSPLVKALVDLEACLKMPLEDIANLNSNSLHLLTTLNFLSGLSFEDGALSHGLKAAIQSLHQDSPSIMYSFKPAFAMFNKFSKLSNEAQDKKSKLREHISMLQREIQDCEAELSSLEEKMNKCTTEIIELEKERENVLRQRSKYFTLPYSDWKIVQEFIDELGKKDVEFKEQISWLKKEMQCDEAKISSLQKQKEKCAVEIREFKKECENVRKQKSEMVKDQRKFQQQLFGVYHNWSIRCSQFQHNYIDLDAHQIVQSRLEDNSEYKKGYCRETTEKIHSKETNVQAISEIGHLSIELKTNQSVPPITSQNLTKDDRGRIESFTSLPEASSNNQIKFKGTEMDIDKDTKANSIIDLQDIDDDQSVAKAFVDLEACLKMPLKDIVTSDSNSLCLHNALNFLFHLSFKDAILSHGVKDAIQSLHSNFTSIIYFSKPAFATLNKFSKILNEAQEKETKLKEHISVLDREILDCEAEVSSLQEKKKNCAAEMIELKKEFENVRKEKSKMTEDQQKVQQQLLQANHRWSILYSQFQLNNIAARNPLVLFH
ncbi:uncharacterized protein LOC129303893 isoform X2 [Prosopis cineraria]|uniref:uncharacterized protein LOC129303893 isoform X2 n=1 Tax=Prosopis cineraria TaxID=364024 RepID=UPI00240FDF2B|nr:uncharacterized protein LOC129303893 isoform X2 [Prosopis cineraria]